MKRWLPTLFILLCGCLVISACSSDSTSPQIDFSEPEATEITVETAASRPDPSPTVVLEPTPTFEPTSLPTVEKEPVRILFIGSSHIFHGPTGHNLPRMFSGMAEAGGHPVSEDRSSDSGVWLIHHLDNNKTMNKLENEDWDYVILQEDMYMGAREDGRQENMFPAIRALDEVIRANGAETVLFNTWVNPAPIREDNLADYQANQAMLSAGYREIAQELDLLLAPVDQAFLRSLEERPDLYLWSEADEHGHANFYGSYLAAAVFYAMIFGVSPEGLDFVYGSEEISHYLQSIAAEAVLVDSTG